MYNIHDQPYCNAHANTPLLLITFERVDFMPALAVGMPSWCIDANQATPFD